MSGGRPHVLSALVLIALALGATGARAADPAPPPIRHVFVILLENENADETFGPDSPAPYLSKELPAQGALLRNYYAVTHLSLGNYIAMVSGQGSNPATQADCQIYQELLPGTIGPDGQALGAGCVYPSSVKTVADQLTAKGLRWRGYMEDMANGKPGEAKTCRHPELNTPDGTQHAKVGDQYAARHNPFVYFHSIIDTPDCAADDLPLERLPGDLTSVETTANYNFITPNLCNDAHDSPCVDGQPGGLKTADGFLREWVPKILASPAFKQDGLLLISFDEAEAEPGAEGDASSCCSQPQFPNTPNNGGPVVGPGGGRIGAVALSPFIRPGTVSQVPYNHFSFLRSTEDIFGLSHLGYAARDGLRPFGDDVYTGRAAAALAREPFKLDTFHERSPIGVIGGDENFGCRAAGAVQLRLGACTVELRARDGAKIVVAGRGSRSTSDRRSFKVDVNLTSAGRALMRRHPRGFRATLEVKGTDVLGRTERVSQRVTLRRGHR